MSTRKSCKRWNIKGIAESVIREIEEEGEDIDDVLDYYLQRVYWTIHSRSLNDAAVVVALVREYIEDVAERAA